MAVSGETKDIVNSISYDDKSQEKNIKEDLKACLKEANLIKEKVEDPELKAKFEKEYFELEQTIIQSIIDDQLISISERQEILYELSDVLNLAKTYNISTDFREIDKLGGVFSGIKKEDTRRIENEANYLRNKTLEQYQKNPQSAMTALKFLNKEYSDLPEGNVGFERDSIASITDKKDANTFQDKLIDIILGGSPGDNKNYNNEYVKCFSNEKGGNHLVKISDFEKEIKNTSNFQELNREGLKSYLGYLKTERNNLPKLLRERFGKAKSKEIIGFYDRNKEDKFFGDDIASFISEASIQLEKYVNEIISGVVSSFSQAQTVEELNTVITQQNETIASLEGDEKENLFRQMQEKIDSNKSAFTAKFITHLESKKYSKEDSEKIANDFVENLRQNLTIDKYKEALSLINKFNTDYQADFVPKEVINESTQIKAEEKNLEKLRLVEEKKNAKTPEEKEKIEVAVDKNNQALQDIEAVQKLNEKATQEEIQKIAEGKVTVQEVVTRIRSEDKDFDNYFKQYEQQKAEYEKKYPPIVEKKPEEVKTNPQNLQANLPETQKLQTQNELVSLDGNYTLKTPNKEISITQKEAEMIQNNPEAEKNLINFRETLDELGINKLWDFRENIFTALENKSGNAFDENDNFLGKSEVVNFLGNTLVALGLEKEVRYNASLDVIKQEFKIKNQVGAILDGGINQVNGNTTIEQAFVNNFCPIENNGRFEYSKFCESI